MKLLPKELATALSAIFVPISVSYFNLQWKIHKVVAHSSWVRPSLVHSLFPVCPYQFLGGLNKLII